MKIETFYAKTTACAITRVFGPNTRDALDFPFHVSGAPVNCRRLELWG